MRVKKFLAGVLCAVFLCSLAACGGQGIGGETNADGEKVTYTVPEAAAQGADSVNQLIIDPQHHRDGPSTDTGDDVRHADQQTVKRLLEKFHESRSLLPDFCVFKAIL